MFRTEERTVKFNFKCIYKHLSKNKYQNKLNQSAGIERSLFQKGDTSMNSLFYWPLKLKSIHRIKQVQSGSIIIRQEVKTTNTNRYHT